MPLPRVNLDDRDYNRLVDEAMARARETCPAWTDLSPADPGRALIEAFAYLTDITIYRLNRLPDKAFVAFLNLLGGDLAPPSAATVRLTLTRAGGGDDEAPIAVPVGTRVADTGSAPQTFTTLSPVQIEAGASTADVLAVHAEWVNAEPLRLQSLQQGALAQLANAPVIAALAGEPGLQVALRDVGFEAGEIEGLSTRDFGGARYVLLPEAPNAAEWMSGATVLCARASGRVVLSPAAAALARDGAELRAWYLKGGGVAGNVAAGRLSRLVDAVPGVTVSNAEPAAGGRDVEALAAALERVPRQFFALRRAVTAADFALLARSVGGVARAFARNRATLWAHARPGSVDLLLLAEPGSGGTGADAAGSTETLRERVHATVERQMPVGVELVVGWVRTKPLAVRLRVHPFPEADPARTRRAVQAELERLVTPFGSWSPGHAIRSADVYRAVLGVPGVRTADGIAFEVAATPDDEVNHVAADAHQEATWFAAAASTVFRSLNDAASWESVDRLDGMTARRVESHPHRAGYVAAIWAVGTPNEGTARIRVSTDCGETWTAADLGFDSWVHDLAWHPDPERPALFIAGRRGFYRWDLPTAGTGTAARGTLLPLDVDPALDADGFYAVVSGRTGGGTAFVAVAAREQAGVFLAFERTVLEPFQRLTDSSDVDFRTLRIHGAGARRFLVACAREPGSGAGRGAVLAEIGERHEDTSPWQSLRSRWNGGSCYDVVVAGTTIFGASHRAGVLQAPFNVDAPEWAEPDIDCGLPHRGRDRLFQPTVSLAVSHAAGPNPAVLAAGPAGVYRYDADAGRWRLAARRHYDDLVPLPPTWLFTSGRHEVEVADDA